MLAPAMSTNTDCYTVAQVQLWIQYTPPLFHRLKAVTKGAQPSDAQINEWNTVFKKTLQQLDLLCPVEPASIEIKYVSAQIRGHWVWKLATHPASLQTLQARLLSLSEDVMNRHHVALIVYRDHIQAFVVPQKFTRMSVSFIPVRNYIGVETVANKTQFLESERFNLKPDQLKPPFAAQVYRPELRTSSTLPTITDVVPGGHSGHQITPTPVSYPIPAVAIAALNLRQAQRAAARAGTAPNIPTNAHKVMLGIPKAQPRQTETVIATPVNRNDNNVVPMKKIDTGVQVSIAEEEIASLRSALAKETVARVEATYASGEATQAYKKATKACEKATKAYKKEHAERLRLESQLQDVKKELQAIRQEDNTPFVVPAMMDAFARLVELGGEMTETRPFNPPE